MTREEVLHNVSKHILACLGCLGLLSMNIFTIILWYVFEILFSFVKPFSLSMITYFLTFVLFIGLILENWRDFFEAENVKERRRLKEFQSVGQTQELPPIQYSVPRPVLVQGDPGVRLVQAVTVSSPRVRYNSHVHYICGIILVPSNVDVTNRYYGTKCRYSHSNGILKTWNCLCCHSVNKV